MSPKSYLVLSGSLFLAIAIVHLLRLLNGWAVLVAGWSAPTWVSWVGLIVAGGLSLWGLRLAAAAD